MRHNDSSTFDSTLDEDGARAKKLVKQLESDHIELASDPPDKTGPHTTNLALKIGATFGIWAVYLWAISQNNVISFNELLPIPAVVTAILWGMMGVGVMSALLLPIQASLLLFHDTEAQPLELIFSSSGYSTLTAIIVGLLVGWSIDAKRRTETQITEVMSDKVATENSLVPLLNAGRELLMQLDSKGMVISYNHPRSGLFSQLPKAAVGKRVQRLLWPAVADLVMERSISSIREKRARGIEQTITLGGENIHLDIRAIPLGVSRVLISIRDITKFRRNEISLRISKERFALAIQGANDGMWDWNLITGEVYWSHRWREMLGLSVDRVDGRISDWLNRVHPKDKDLVQKEIKETLKSDNSHYESEHRIRHSKKTYRWMLARGVILRDANGKVTRVAGSFTDVTERRLTTATHEKSALLEHATEAVGVGIAIVIPNGHLTKVSPTLVRMISDWDDPEGWWAHVQEKIIPPQSSQCEVCGKSETHGTTICEVVTPKGRIQVFEVVFTGHGHGVTTQQPATVLLVRNVTRRMVAEEHLRRLNAQLVTTRDQALAASRSKSTFLANMSHELRTPLNAILGYTEMLVEETEDAGGEQQTVDDLKKVHTAGSHLLRLIGGVLDLSKIEAGRMELFIEQFYIGDLIDDVVATVKPLILEGRNKLVVKQSDNIGSMNADMTKVRQILFNLLSNACKFTTDGTITLSIEEISEPSEMMVHFSITDTGIGMSQQEVEHIFDEFYQADSSTTRPYGGTGLGLSISRRFCLMMGGDIKVESTQNVGTTFTAMLPNDVEPFQDELGPMLLTGITPKSSAIVAIDRNRPFLDLLRNGFHGDGHSILCAESAEDGLSLAIQHRPKLLFVDTGQGREETASVVEKIRSADTLREVPLLFVCGTNKVSAILASKEQLSEETEPPPILLIDQDEDQRKMMSEALTNGGFDVYTASTKPDCEEVMHEEKFGLVVVAGAPEHLPALQFLTKLNINAPVILILRGGNLDDASDDHISSFATIPPHNASRFFINMVRGVTRQLLTQHTH